MPKRHKPKQHKKTGKRAAKAQQQARFSAVLSRWGGRVPAKHHKKQSKKQKKHPSPPRRVLDSHYLWQIIVVLIIVIMSFMIWLIPRQLPDVFPTAQSESHHLHSAHPIALPSMNAQANCNERLLTYVAHEDDDLLFMNPSVLHAIEGGSCLRTVYVTAGDDGRPDSYWHSRALGAEAAYARMFHVPNKWKETDAVIESHLVEAAYLQGQPRITLTFIHLPDGSPSGTGFSVHGAETLDRLRSGIIPVIHTVDTRTSYTRSQLIATLGAFMTLDKPTVIYTQAYASPASDGDHSDHRAVGYFTDQARQNYHRKHQFHLFLGYPLNGLPANLSEADSMSKAAIFKAYEQYDTAICTDVAAQYCPQQQTYTNYLSREYEYIPGSS